MYGFKEDYVVVEVPQSGDIRKPIKGFTYTSEPALKACGLM